MKKPHQASNSEKLIQGQCKVYPKSAIGNYIIEDTIGEGTFGKVKLGTHIPTKEKVKLD
jgi:serine/threonine protein kinase